MLRCRPAKTDRIPLRSDFPAGTSFPRRDYPSAGGIPGAAAFAGTSPDRGKRIRKTTKRETASRSRASIHSSSRCERNPTTIEPSVGNLRPCVRDKALRQNYKKERERTPGHSFPVGLASLHTESVLTSKPPLRSYATVSGDDLRDKLLKFSSRYKTHNRKIPCICGTIPFRGVDRQ